MGAAKQSEFNVVVVGAGPSGLVLALLLAKQGIPVTVLEKSDEYDKQPRASFYSAPAIYELQRAGVMDEVYARAFHANGVSWRHIDGTLIANIYAEDAPEEDRMVSLPLDELIPLIASHLEKQPGAQILLEHEVLASGQDEHQAWVDVKTPDGERRFSATYIVGCDGGSSKIRRDLFGKSFPGHTWDQQVVATNVYYPGLAKYGWKLSSNFLVSSEHFPMVAQISNDGMLRVTYGEDGNLTREEMLARQPEKYKAFLPGKPEPHEYQIVNFSPYKIHQRLAEKLRVGRFLLAADAAHLCNPYGGMGLTGGFADVGGLYDCLYGIYAGRADDSILDKYDVVRREKYRDVIDPISSSNLRRLWDLEAIEQDQFFQMARRMETDKAFAREMQGGMRAVMHDFTQYYEPLPSGV
ncbi:hypothetical protein LTR36_003478 [Oleoguttula mirabilis]|uniref:FAD-binding domain-containing protein n=1 Tax=Oleoguttula mirabilis TaxID=1507867 RepID=A0AAV9JJG1_9PEZI|nr:hypothetical protein LTR36_003478 [Oleoguttula mirabilis]